jgi:hypothetical protein
MIRADGAPLILFAIHIRETTVAQIWDMTIVQTTRIWDSMGLWEDFIVAIMLPPPPPLPLAHTLRADHVKMEPVAVGVSALAHA